MTRQLHILLSLALRSLLTTRMAVGENCNATNSDTSSLTFSARCCNGQSYDLGHQDAFLLYFRNCRVEPAGNVSIAQSNWIFYGCLIENQLGKSYTVRSYAKMMVQHMRPAETFAILKTLSRSKKCRRAKGSPVIGTDFIQHAWKSFFQAELQICAGYNTSSDEIRRRDWEPMFTCNGEKTPFILPYLLDVLHVKPCCDRFVRKYGVKTTLELEGYFAFCFLSASGILSEEQVQTKRIDFDSIVQKSMPTIFSWHTKQIIMKGLRIQLCQRFESLRVFFTSFNEIVPISLNDPVNANSLAKRDEDEQLFFSNLLILQDIISAGVRAIIAVINS